MRTRACLWFFGVLTFCDGRTRDDEKTTEEQPDRLVSACVDSVRENEGVTAVALTRLSSSPESRMSLGPPSAMEISNKLRF